MIAEVFEVAIVEVHEDSDSTSSSSLIQSEAALETRKWNPEEPAGLPGISKSWDSQTSSDSHIRICVLYFK